MNIKQRAYSEITNLRELIKKNGFLISEISQKQYNFELTATKSNIKNKIQIYFGKKGIKKIIQGNKESKEYLELNGLLTGELNLQLKTEDREFTNYIGTDETGKGDYFGPLVIAGFYADKEILNFLTSLDVKDSKELTDTKINEIAPIIKNRFKSNFSIISIPPEKYNVLYTKFNNVNRLLDWGHSKVIENIYKFHKPETVIIDKFSSTPLPISKDAEYRAVDFIQMTRAEKFLGVAAASILARNEMNNWFTKMKNNGFDVLKGASGQVENSAREIYRVHGKETFEKLVKLHFKTTQKIFDS